MNLKFCQIFVIQNISIIQQQKLHGEFSSKFLQDNLVDGALMSKQKIKANLGNVYEET